MRPSYVANIAKCPAGQPIRPDAQPPTISTAEKGLVGVCPHAGQVELAIELAGLADFDQPFYCGWTSRPVSDIGFLAGRSGTEYTPLRVCRVAKLVVREYLSRHLEHIEAPLPLAICTCDEINVALDSMRITPGFRYVAAWDHAVGHNDRRGNVEFLVETVLVVLEELIRGINSCPCSPGEEFEGWVS